MELSLRRSIEICQDSRLILDTLPVHPPRFQMATCNKVMKHMYTRTMTGRHLETCLLEASANHNKGFDFITDPPVHVGP